MISRRKSPQILSMSSSSVMRLDALLSRFGYCSRREAPQWIKGGRITYKGEPCTQVAQKVTPEGILVDGAPPDFPEGVLVAFHKPLGYICSHDEEEGDIIYDLLPHRWQYRNPVVSSIGRLDKDTSGLLLLTDDGKINHKLSSPKHHVAKTYLFTTAEDVPNSAIEVFAQGGLLLEGERQALKPAEMTLLSPRKGLLTLHEGKYHQVRRMLESQGAPVLTLCRLSFGKLSLEGLNLAEGEWKEVSLEDIL